MMHIKSFENRLRKVAQALQSQSPDVLFITAEPGESAEQAMEKAMAEYSPGREPQFVLSVQTWHPDMDESNHSKR